MATGHGRCETDGRGSLANWREVHDFPVVFTVCPTFVCVKQPGRARTRRCSAPWPLRALPCLACPFRPALHVDKQAGHLHGWRIIPPNYVHIRLGNKPSLSPNQPNKDRPNNHSNPSLPTTGSTDLGIMRDGQPSPAQGESCPRLTRLGGRQAAITSGGVRVAGDPSDSSHSWAWRAGAAACSSANRPRLLGASCWQAAGPRLLSCLVSSHLAMNERRAGSDETPGGRQQRVLADKSKRTHCLRMDGRVRPVCLSVCNVRCSLISKPTRARHNQPIRGLICHPSVIFFFSLGRTVRLALLQRAACSSSKTAAARHRGETSPPQLDT